MKVKTKSATGAVLDYLVAAALSRGIGGVFAGYVGKAFSTDQNLGSAIIFNEGISLLKWGIHTWKATYDYGNSSEPSQYGDTALEAGLRCFVAKYLGEEVDVPESVVTDGLPEVRTTRPTDYAKGSIGKHDWIVGEWVLSEGFPVYVDDRQLTHRLTMVAAINYALGVIQRLQEDGDYRLNDKPAGFMPPPIKG